jgi:Asp-tRNA(Asn)/Glu-tRNA(Gln) amidotransferase B subunit
LESGEATMNKLCAYSLSALLALSPAISLADTEKPQQIVDSISIKTDSKDKTKKVLIVEFYNGKTIEILLSKEQLEELMSSEKEIKRLSKEIFNMFLE